MKKLLLLLTAFLSISSYAQRSGGGGRGQNQNFQGSQNQQKQRKFSSSEIAGIFYYDIDDVIKKIKIKDEKKQNSVTKLLRNYNFKIKEISFLNSKKFTDLDVIVASTANVNNREARLTMRKKVEEIISPVRKQVIENEEKLNKLLETGLTEKQFKKWIKYQKKKKESLQPKQPQNNQNQGSRQGGGGGRGSRGQ